MGDSDAGGYDICRSGLDLRIGCQLTACVALFKNIPAALFSILARQNRPTNAVSTHTWVSHLELALLWPLLCNGTFEIIALNIKIKLTIII